MNEGEIRGEIALFRAIIVRAIKDAFSTNYPSTAISSLDKKQARFFLCDDPAFYEYCEFANVSGTRIRRGAKKLASMPPHEATVLYRQLLKDDR